MILLLCRCDGFGRDFVQGGDFTDIKAMNNSGGDGNLRF